MNTELRDGIQSVAKESLHVVKGYMMGDEKNQSRVSTAIKAIGFGLKVEHMNQMKVHGDKSLALRLLPFLKDESSRNEYIKITNPEIEHLIISRPVTKVAPKKGAKNGR